MADKQVRCRGHIRVQLLSQPQGCSLRFLVDMFPVTTPPGKRKLFPGSAEMARPAHRWHKRQAARFPVAFSSKRFAALHGGCRQSSDDKRGWVEQLLTRTGETTFICLWEGCGYSCVRSSDLTKHKRRHTGEKPVVCPWEGCRRTCSRLDNLRLHLRLHTREKLCICGYEGCGYSCIQPSDMRKHKRVHSGEKPFVCCWEGCGRAYGRLDNLRLHVRSHTGEKNFACPVAGCGRAFTQSTNLTRHLRVHSGEKPFACPHEGCGYASNQSGSLTRHLCVHTGKGALVFPSGDGGYSSRRSGKLKKYARVYTKAKSLAGWRGSRTSRDRQDRGGARHSPCPPMARASGFPQPSGGRAMPPDGAENPYPRPWLSSLSPAGECAELAPMLSQHFDISDWQEPFDASLSWSLWPLRSVDMSDQDLCSFPLTDDDKAFWMGLVDPENSAS